MKTGNIAILGKLEAEALGVVVEILNFLENQGKEALVAALESYRRRADRLGDVLVLGTRRGRAALGGKVPVASTTGAKS